MLALLISGLVVLPRMASADAESFAVSWAPSTEPPCVAPEALEDAVVAKLGRNPFVAVDRADVVLEGRDLSSTSGRLRARVEQRDREGHLLGARELAAASCAELLQSTAFVIALIVDPDAPFLQSESRTDIGRAAPAADRRRRREPRPPVQREQERRQVPPLLYGAVGGTFTKGLLPGGDVGAAVMLGLTPWSLPLRFEWRGTYHRSLEAPRGGAFFALAQEWRACFLVLPKAMLGGSACLGGAWATIFPQGIGLHNGDRTPKGVFGPAIGLGPTLRAGPFEILTDVSLMFPRPRWAFSYADELDRLRLAHELEQTVISATIGVARTF